LAGCQRSPGRQRSPVVAHVVASTYAPQLATSGHQWSPVVASGCQLVASCRSPVGRQPVASCRQVAWAVMDRRPAIYGSQSGCGQSMVGMEMRHRYSRYNRYSRYSRYNRYNRDTADIQQRCSRYNRDTVIPLPAPPLRTGNTVPDTVRIQRRYSTIQQIQVYRRGSAQTMKPPNSRAGGSTVCL
jgi:hypothetical protein